MLLLKTHFLSLFVGILLGAVFSLLRLPIPAPNNLAGILGIFGVFVGFLIVNHFRGG